MAGCRCEWQVVWWCVWLRLCDVVLGVVLYCVVGCSGVSTVLCCGVVCVVVGGGCCGVAGGVVCVLTNDQNRCGCWYPAATVAIDLVDVGVLYM